MRNLLEISDLIVDIDPATLGRKSVNRDEVVSRLVGNGQRSAAAVVRKLPASGGILDPNEMDRLLLRVHCEMQRLSEEFQHGRRVLELTNALLASLPAADSPNSDLPATAKPVRIVDIGCGTGYVIRWLAAHQSEFVRPVELVGVDFNATLVEQANRFAKLESLPCQFLAANAFRLSEPASIYLSTGVVHHFPTEGLSEFFRQHDQPTTKAFAHFDFQPTPLAGPGAWLFHYVRMREALSRHDGVVSALRAHQAETLLRAARTTSFDCGMYSRRCFPVPLPRVFQTIVGVRPDQTAPFRKALGRRAIRLEEMA